MHTYNFHTDARFSVRALLETVIASAFVASFQINAAAVLAKTRINRTLVDILALVHRSYFLISRWTDAHEGADQILALESAIVRRRRALVDV